MLILLAFFYQPQGTETPDAAGSMETGAAERMHDRREVLAQITIKKFGVIQHMCWYSLEVP